jgi:hypothetical protein
MKKRFEQLNIVVSLGVEKHKLNMFFRSHLTTFGTDCWQDTNGLVPIVHGAQSAYVWRELDKLV